MSFYFPLSHKVLNLFAALKVRDFENALKNPRIAQQHLLNKWNKKKAYLEKVQSFEYTSGSGGIKKKIGYTQTLKNSFSDMFQLWAYDVLNNAPVKFSSGVIYMSISPRINDHGGLDNDAEYISPFIRPLVKKFLAVDPSIQRASSGKEFYFKTAEQLLRRKDLEIISIWSPTYFLNFMEFIRINKNELKFSGNFQAQWPKLKMISAWSSGESQISYELLKHEFPNVWFQGKGLIATEGPMTIPWINADGYLPLVNHTYFDFLDELNNKIKLHELVIGHEYEIFPHFPNTRGPCSIEDKVVCTGHYYQTPMLEFIGRKGDNSDMVGEKLSGKILREMFITDFSNFIFIPNASPPDSASKPFYTMLVEEAAIHPSLDSRSVEHKLQCIHHYKLARELGQLGPSRLIKVSGLKNEIKKIQLKLGINEGNQKDYTIIKRPEIKNALYEWALSISSIE